MKFFTDFYEKKNMQVQFVQKNEKEISFTFFNHPLLNGMVLEKKQMRLWIEIEEKNEIFQQYYQQKEIESLSLEEQENIYALIDWFQEKDPQPKIMFHKETIGRSLIKKRKDFKESKTGKWVKIEMPEFHSFQRTFKQQVQQWLKDYEQTHIDLDYMHSNLHKQIRYYYCGVKSTIEFHWSKQKIVVKDIYHQEEYIAEKDEVPTYLEHIFTKIEKEMRIKNTLRPQRYHFDHYTKKFFRQKEREKIYHALLKVMTPQKIEQVSAEKRKQKVEIQWFEDEEKEEIVCYILNHRLVKPKHETTWNV